MADGTVYIDTEVNSDGFGEAFSGYSEDIKKVASELYELTKQQKEVAETHKQNTAEVEKTSAALDRLIENQIRYTETGGKTDNRTFAQMEYDIENTTTALEMARAKQAETAQSLSTLNASVDSTRARLQEMAAQENYTSENASMLQNTVNGIKQAFKSLLPNLSKATRSVAQFAGRSVVNGIKSLGSKIKQMATSMLTLKKNTGGANTSLLKMVGAAFGIRSLYNAIRKAVDYVKEGMNNLVQYSGETNASLSALKSSLTQLKNSLATAFAPILNVIAPILTQFINLLSKAASIVGAFFSALSGKKTYTAAIAVQEDYASSLDKTAKSANKAEKAQKSYTSSLDELNIISKDEDESDLGGGAGGGIDPSAMFKEMPISDSIMAFADKLKEIFSKIKEFIQNEDWDGLGKYIASGINIALQYLYDALNWKNVEKKVMPFITAFTKTFNSLVDNIDWDLLGRTIGTGINTLINIVYELITGIDWENLGKKFGEGINGLFDEIDWSKAGETFGESQKGLLDIIIGFLEETNWQEIANSVVKFIGGIDWSGVTSRVFEGIGAALGALDAFLTELTIAPWRSVFDRLKEIAFEDGQFTMQGLLDGILSVAENIGNWLLENVVNPFVEGFQNAFAIHSPSTLMAEFGVFIMQGLINGIESLVIDLILSINRIKESVVNIFKEVKESVIAIWDEIVKGIKTAVNGIIGVINGMISGIVSGINNMISALNSLKFDVPDWVPELGGKTFSLNVSKISAPQIPYLATGAVIPPNAPFVAMLGDQKNGRNIEAPEDLIRQIVREESGSNQKMMDILLQIAQNTRETADKDLTIGDREIAKANLRGQNSMGYSLIMEG